jgi:thermitase
LRKIYLSYIILVIILFCITNTYALEVKIAGDRLSVYADQVPLQSILQRIADLGIIIRIEPQLNPKISASFENWKIQKGLASILKPVNHVLIWNSIEGPLGPISRLAEIQVFKPGKKELIKPLGTRSVLSIAGNSKNGALFVKDEILLRFKPGMSLVELTKLLKQIGGTVVDSNAALGIYKIRLEENSDISSLVEQVSKHPRVAKAEPNYVYPIAMPYKKSAPTAPISMFFDNLSPEGSAPVAILDTGLGSDSGLQGFVLASFDAMNPAAPISDPLGHGTQMALIAAGVVKPFGAGEDFKAQIPIIPIRAFDNNGFTSNFSIMRSIDFAINHGARVMSLSWGSETRSGFLENVLDLANAKSLIVVASAGNEPTGKPVYPAAYPSVVGVGALAPDGKFWKRSNYGNFVRLSAPGFATLPVGYKGDPGVYAGTSIAAAFVANIIANYISANPKATKQEILTLIERKQNRER